MHFGDLIFKTTGIMTQKTIMRHCSEVGRQITERLNQTGGTISPENISEIISGVVGKRIKNISLAYNKDSITKIFSENFQLAESVARENSSGVRAMAIPRLLGKRTGLIVPQENNVIQNVNFVPHELEHALVYTFKFNKKIKQVLNNVCKKLPKKIFNTNKYGNQLGRINATGKRMQGQLIYNIGHLGGNEGITNIPATMESLLKQSNCKNVEELRLKIREMLYTENILGTKNYWLNFAKLKFLKSSIKDESNAYKIGGLSEKHYMELMGMDMEGKCSRSELVSLLYKETYKVLNKEQHHAFANVIKSLFGLKQNKKFETECIARYEAANQPKIVSFNEQINMMAENLALAEEVIKETPNSKLAKLMLSGMDERFEPLCRKFNKTSGNIINL